MNSRNVEHTKYTSDNGQCPHNIGTRSISNSSRMALSPVWSKVKVEGKTVHLSNYLCTAL